MTNPCFDVPHGFAGLDRCRTGHAANQLPGCLGGVVKVRIRIGECLAFHVLIIANFARVEALCRLLVLSFPGADRCIRMEGLQQGKAVSRRYRNRRIGEFLKELDLAEGRSTGVPKILRAMRNNGSPAPSFETDDDRTWFRVRLPVHPSFPAGVGDASGEQDTPQDNQLENKEIAVVSPHDTPQDALQVTERVGRLVGAIQHEMSRAELQAALKLRDRRSFIDTYLKPALEAGLIEMTLPDRPTSGNQRYRRTPAGEALARHIKESST